MTMFRVTRELLITKCKDLIKCQRRLISKATDIEMFINGKPIKVPSYYTVLQALRREQVTVPTFCYHYRLSIAGNCRMCLVEVEGMWKPQIACSMPVSKNMKVRTNSATTLRAQESVLEFILLDHPLDCPICDQGGECDLQDLSMRFGNDRTRFTDIHFEGKRAVEDKYLGPLIRTKMNRCIHCTRCIRFASQVCGLDVLGTTGRGPDMLVGTYVDKMFLSELSGNIIDLCPVGALTAIPYMFKARPWEVIRTNSIDVTDATGTNISLNHRFNRVIRVLPRENGEVNQEWVSDKGRWSIDSLEMQRIVSPMYKVNDCLAAVEWDCALSMAGTIIKECDPYRLMMIAGPHSSVETLVAAKDLLNKLGSDHAYHERGLFYSSAGIDLRAAYALNIKMKDIVKADKILLVGTNPRFENPILNVWIREAYRTNECDIYYLGPQSEFNYHVHHVGTRPSDLSCLPPEFKYAKKPLIFIGISQLENPQGSSLMWALMRLQSEFTIFPDWNIMHVIPREASWGGALEAGWKPGAKHAISKLQPRVIISLGADEIFHDICLSQDCKVIYIGFQGDRGSQVSSVVLPGCAFSEAGGIYLNLECRSQQAFPAVTPPGKARLDWKIIRALSEYCCIPLPYDDANQLYRRISEISPNFCHFNDYQDKLYKDFVPRLVYSGSTCLDTDSIKIDMAKLSEYYCSDVFSSNSPTMVKAQKAAEEFPKLPYSAV